MKKETVIIIILSIIIIWFSLTIIRLENYHYASQLGFCDDVSLAKKEKCLNEKETRTNSLWHLLYGLKIF